MPDASGEVALEAADRLARGLAFAASAGGVVAGGLVAAGGGDDAGLGEELRRDLLHERADLALEPVDGRSQFAQAAQRVAVEALELWLRCARRTRRPRVRRGGAAAIAFGRGLWPSARPAEAVAIIARLADELLKIDPELAIRLDAEILSICRVPDGPRLRHARARCPVVSYAVVAGWLFGLDKAVAR